MPTPVCVLKVLYHVFAHAQYSINNIEILRVFQDAANIGRYLESS